MILMIHIVSAVISVKANEAMLLIYYVVSRETMELAVDWCNGFKSHLLVDTGRERLIRTRLIWSST